MSDLYGEDILLWSKHQAGLLRRMADGEHVGDQVDWEHVIDEIADAGDQKARANIPADALAGLHDAVAAAQDALGDIAARLQALTAARWQRGSEMQITLSITPEQHKRINAIAHRQRASQTAVLMEWISDRLKQEAT